MNLFRRGTPKPIPESDLYALHLNELSPRRARAVRRALAADPALAEESAAIAATLGYLRTVHKDVPMKIDDSVLERNWRALRPALRAHVAPLTPAPWRPFLAGALLAASAGVLLFCALHTSPIVHQPVPVNTANAAPAAAANGGSGPRTQQPASGKGRSAPPTDGTPQPHLPGGAPAIIAEQTLPAPASLHPAAAPRVHLLPLSPVPVPFSQAAALLTLEPQPVLTLTPDPALLTAAEQPLDLKPVDLKPVLHQAGGKPAQPGRSSAGSGDKQHHIRTTDLMLGMGGTFVLPHSSVVATNQFRAESVSNAVSAIAAFHQQFRPKLGYRITLSYTRPDFIYNAGSGGIGTQSGSINARVFALAGTYVAQGPHRGRLTTSLDAGAALLAFVPTEPNPQTSYGYRPAGVLGFNADYAVTKRLGVRASYRAQVFKSPDFRYSGSTVPVTAFVTLSNEPAVGITYRFGKQ